MAHCSYCGRETELRQAGMATCIECTDRVVRSVHGQLVQELLEAIAEFESIEATDNRFTGGNPRELSQPYGAQCMPTNSNELSIAQENLRRTGNRLAAFLDFGTIPENLK